MNRPSNDQVLVEAVFNDFLEKEYPGDDPDEVFLRFASLQVLKPHEVTVEQLTAGIVDGEKDGGIDSVFFMLDGRSLEPDDPIFRGDKDALRLVRERPDVQIVVVQAKNSTAWEESAWEHLLYSMRQLLQTDAEIVELEKLYRSTVVERTGMIRQALRFLAPKFPHYSVKIAYVGKGPDANVTDTVFSRADEVQKLVSRMFPDTAQVTAEMISAKQLYALAESNTSAVGNLNFSKLQRLEGAYLGVVTLEDYLHFVRDENGVLREELFDSNVRDFEGDNQVNEAIADTIAKHDEAEFWWLNNGVTILGDKVDGPQYTLTISRPLIVNGLQTTHVLDRAQRSGHMAVERLRDRIVVRVIETTDEEIRDRIIAGTNRQTQVPGPALYATHPLQRKIESYLRAHGWYYERRKNRYKNLGIPAKKRVTMNYLAQAMITLMLGQPDEARARPSTVLARSGGHEDVFPAELDLDAYLVAVEVLKGTETFLTTSSAKAILDEFTNARFYVAFGYVVLMLGIRDNKKICFDANYVRLRPPLNKTRLEQALTILKAEAAKYQTAHPDVSRDAMFKSVDFRTQYFGALTATMPKRSGGRRTKAAKQ